MKIPLSVDDFKNQLFQLSLALVACICPFMACGTGLGGLFLIGVRFGSVLAVTPFLVLSIGVDDAYLMIHAWQRVTQKRRRHPVKDDSATERLAEVCSCLLFLEVYHHQLAFRYSKTPAQQSWSVHWQIFLRIALELTLDHRKLHCWPMETWLASSWISYIR